MKLSIVIPVFNEEKTVAWVLSKLAKLDLGVKKEIIVVDDGSTDETARNLKTQVSKLRSYTQLAIITHDTNQGKGVAVRTGIKNSTGDYILIQDADLEYNPEDIKRLIKPIIEGNAKVVYGTRLKRLPNFTADERTPQFFLHYIGNKLLSIITSALYGQWITDMETGYKLFPKKTAGELALSAKSFDFEPEITAKLLKKGFKILEIPIKTNPRGYSQGKKLNTIKDGIAACVALVKYRIVD